MVLSRVTQYLEKVYRIKDAYASLYGRGRVGRADVVPSPETYVGSQLLKPRREQNSLTPYYVSNNHRSAARETAYANHTILKSV
jgi:hypothetical protein